MLVIAICNTKGGVGKTTLTAALGVRAAQDGHRVGMADLDPQESLAQWFKARGRKDNPRIYTGTGIAADAVAALKLDGCDVAFLDGPPAFLQTILGMVAAANIVVVPMRPNGLDIGASRDAVKFAIDAGKPLLIVLNDVVAREKAAADAREYLEGDAAKLRVAKTLVAHRASHASAMVDGKTAAELRDAAASEDIDELWREIAALGKLKGRKGKRR